MTNDIVTCGYCGDVITRDGYGGWENENEEGSCAPHDEDECPDCESGEGHDHDPLIAA